MTTGDLNTGVSLNAQLTAINAAQAILAVSGSKVAVSALDSAGNTSITAAALKAALGESNYNTLVAGVLGDLNSALTSAETAAQTAFDAL